MELFVVVFEASFEHAEQKLSEIIASYKKVSRRTLPAIFRHLERQPAPS